MIEVISLLIDFTINTTFAIHYLQLVMPTIVRKL